MAFEDFRKHVEGLFSKEAFKRFAIESEIELEKIKDFILDSVESHPVSQEINSKVAPSSYLQSSTASLFGFIGFVDGRDPVSELVEYLDKALVIQKNKATLGNRISGTFARLNLPTKSELRGEESLLPDFDNGGRSWVEMIENGVSGLDKYLQYEGRGRSTEGYQTKNKVREGNFTGVKYLTSIFSEARKRIRNI